MKNECVVWVPDPKQRDPHQRCAQCGRPRDRHDLVELGDGSLATNVERRA